MTLSRFCLTRVLDSRTGKRVIRTYAVFELTVVPAEKTGRHGEVDPSGRRRGGYHGGG